MRTLLLALALLTVASAQAQVQGVGYRLTPSANYVDFESDAALSDGLLYGGGLGLSFGEFIELGGTYQLGSFETDLAGLTGLPDSVATSLSLLAPRDVSVQRYGGALKLNLLRTFLVPYVTLGTGVVRFAPEGLEATRSIYLLGGAGVQATVADRFAVSLAAEDFAFRFNPGTAFISEADASGAGPEAVGQRTVHNLGLRAAASVYLGGRRPGSLTAIDREFQRQFSGGLSGLSLVVEPFYGRVDFDDAFAYRDQTFVGAEAGFDFGPLVGVRGFYGRGTSTGVPTDIEGIQMFGGDLRLRLSEGRGLVPFLSVGGGYLDVRGGYASDEGATEANALAEDAPFAAAGAGAGFLLSPRFRAIAEIRGILMSTQDVEDLSGPDNVYLSTFLRGGVSFGIGGRAGRRVAVVREAELDTERAAFDAEREELEATREALRAEVAALEAQRDAARRQALAREAALLDDLDARLARARDVGDSLAVARLGAEQEALRARIADNEAALARADSLATTEAVLDSVRVEEIEVEEIIEAEEVVEAERMVTIPLPREGELYVRYGPPGGVVIQDGAPGGLPEADLRAAVREALLDVLADDPATTTLTEGDVAAIEQRVVDRLLAPPPASGAVTLDDLERMERRLEARLLDALRAALAERDAAPEE